MEPQKFSLRSRAKSFQYAGAGIARFLKTEHNAWIHLAATLVVIVAGWMLKVTYGEAAALVLAVGLVWVTEMLNTCLERTMDLISRDQHPGIGYIKDLAAGAVLVASVAALVTGLFIFIPKIL
ncbi:MAG TPA: diacylglycerol kinase family protein [Puia sp.]|nr:diacylglycerol kinase family protein [Puia sp.]